MTKPVFMQNYACILCANPGTTLECVLKAGQPLERRFLFCPECELRFVAPECRLNAKQEKERYLNHENDVNNPHYRNFVRPLYNAVKKLLPNTAEGLDFGCGSGPVLYEMFREAGHPMQKYDTFFANEPTVLSRTYDFIAASEVAEHFYFPEQEFKKWHALLRPGGVLAVMTLLFENQAPFADWYYVKDPTHVSLYSKKTFHYIAHTFGFSSVQFLSDRLILIVK